MKKRIVCVLLTLIMLLSLVPMGASAASHSTSAAAITVLKQMTTFKNKCYHYSGSEFRTGYGTVCEEKHSFDKNGNPVDKIETVDGKEVKYFDHVITEKSADTALRKVLTTLDEKVNAFASANGLSLKQNQHDALVVFSYNAGTGWMDGNGVVKSVIINKGSANEMLNAMAKWTNNADMSRRRVEVNMYVNGIYSNTAPSSYGYVYYDANGGDMPQADYTDGSKYTYYYDLYNEINHPVTPTRNGYRFLGWYRNSTSTGGLAWVPSLNVSTNGKTLLAQWQDGQTAVSVSYDLHKSSLASRKVYSKVGAEKSNSDLTEELDEYLDENGSLLRVTKDYIDSNGLRWSYLRDIGGWVKVGAAYDNESTTDSYGTVIATATVTASGYLNLRKEAGTDNAIIGALAKNDTVDIYEIKTVNGHQWGLSKSGWLCLTYTRVIMKDDVSISDEGRLAYAFTGAAKGGSVKVYVEPNSESNYVTYRDPDDKVQTPVIAQGKAVTVTNLAVYKASETWAKVTWMNDEWKYTDKDEGKTASVQNKRSGWVKLVPQPSDAYIELDPVTYTVVADSVNVRSDWGDASGLMMSLNKGVQVKVNLVALVGENMWGRVKIKRSEHVGTDDDTAFENMVENDMVGYVNLASKYFSRDDAPSLDTDDDDTVKGMVATVINTDALRVRKTSSIFAQQIGSLARGTTVAVWEYDDGWYKIDTNKNGVYDYNEDGWCSEQYLDVQKAAGTNSTVTDAAGNQYTTDGTGKGIVANTYAGLHVREGAGTNYASLGKLLPGTVVEILETARGGKWGRTAQGWVSMDYITMVTYNEVEPELPAGTTSVGSYADAEKTTTTAVYTGRINSDAVVYRNPTKAADKAEEIRTAVPGENVTIYELAKVTEVVQSDDEVSEDGKVTTNTTVTTTSYWARINDGWVENPEVCLSLNALDEKVHTQTDTATLKVRTEPETGTVFDALAQGDQVSVTALEIVKDKVWGRIETEEGTGWIRLDYMSEGAVVLQNNNQNNNTTTPSEPTMGIGSSTGGFVTNASGYRYTGKIIRANEVNVRATPSTAADKTTTLSSGQALVIYETTIAENMAWGRCDAGWVYLYYVDLTPVVNGAVDARVVYNDNTIIYTDVNCTAVAGTYSRMSTIDIYEIVGKMARTEQGWVNTDNLL